jgi:(1->4)-alpha-D-glucan 1-alpha-D-glucosylmutase
VTEPATLRATYRLQLSPDLTLKDAIGLVPYLEELGVSHLYLSPVLQARAGSMHGYDVVDPSRVSRELGGERALRALCSAGLSKGLGIILDVVPNHMATSEDENEFWRDPELRAKYFDVDPHTGAHRRFLDIGELGGVRVERLEVFQTTHRLLVELVREGLIDGVRVDHPDGLAAPRSYLERLHGSGVERIWVEKVVEPGEALRYWPVEGTTGYEFANDVQALFIDPRGEGILTELAGEERPWHEVAFEAKLEQATTTFEPEVERLRRLLDVPDLPRELASLPVYRTYVEPWSGRVAKADRDAIDHLSGKRLKRVLLLEERGHDEFVTRFQQLTGPVMAKGVEDTAFYRYVRLLALNEVGGDPGRFGISVEEFHAANAARAARFPNGLLAGTTHDTKRSADVRARIGALAGIAERWREHVLRWHELAAPYREGGAPDWNEELLVYQTLVGAWPIEAERLDLYIEKALREAKRNTNWVEANEEWEGSVQRFARELAQDERFLADFVPFAGEVADLGARSAIGQLVLRLTSPGVPDIYNGDELPYFALVDPDNRRPVDWDARRRALAGLGAGPTRETAKLWVIRELLALRRRHPEAFAGPYEPVEAGEHTCAFRRGDDVLVAVHVRDGDFAVDLPNGAWRDVLAGLAEVTGRRSAAAFERSGA